MVYIILDLTPHTFKHHYMTGIPNYKNKIPKLDLALINKSNTLIAFMSYNQSIQSKTLEPIHHHNHKTRASSQP